MKAKNEINILLDRDDKPSITAIEYKINAGEGITIKGQIEAEENIKLLECFNLLDRVFHDSYRCDSVRVLKRNVKEQQNPINLVIKKNGTNNE